MSSIRPATLRHQTEAASAVNTVRSLTFVVGPPADLEAARQVAETAAGARVTPDELWIEMVRGAIYDALEPERDTRSEFDRLISEALEEKVTLWGVRPVLHVQAGRQFPGVEIETAKILDATGKPIVRDFLDSDLRGRIAHLLIETFEADWVTCTAVYPPEELGFPNLNRAKKEA